MPNSCCQSISQFMACDEFCAIVNDIHDLIGFAISSNLCLALSILIDAGMPS